MKLLRFFIMLCVPVLFLTYCTASPQTQQSSSQEGQEQIDIKTTDIEKQETTPVVPSEPLVQEKPIAPIVPEKNKPKEELQKPEVPKQKPEAPKQKPEVPKQKPEVPKQKPEVPKQKPEVPKQKPEVPKQKPEVPKQKPEVPKQKPEVPKQKPEVPKQKPEVPKKEEKNIVAEFKGVKITKETYTQTKSEIELVVDELNRITAKKDYDRWLSFLSSSYKELYSDVATLKAASEALPVKGIRLRTLKDYFLYVFVPSRQNIKVDDIQFVSPTQVNVLMLYGKNTLLVYRIENTANGWKLIPSK